jgi:anti-sigma B factor antagonist
MEGKMEFSTIQYKRCDLIKTVGRIDGSNSASLEEVMNNITQAGRYKIVFDMSEVNFMSSAGWWVMIRTQKTCKRFNRGEVVLAGVDPRIRGSLDMVGMGSYFKIFNDVTSAVASF